MAYADVTNLHNDADFQGRVTACCATEGAQQPESAMMGMLWQICAAPGFGDAYASGGQESITDAQILSAVQPLLGAA